MIKKTFAVKNLFELEKVTNMLSKNNCIENGKYPVCSSDSTNNGIIGFYDNPEFIIDEEKPVYITFGDHTRTFNIMQKSFSVIDNTKVLSPKITNIKALLYITTIWKKQIKDLGYSRHWKIAKDCELYLPIAIDKKNKPIIDINKQFHNEGYLPNIEYMENYITKLEEERIKILKKYLQSNQLVDYHLNQAEKNILENKKQCFSTFQIGELFDIHPTKSYGLTNNKLFINEGKTPVVVNSSCNNGIGGYVDLPPTEKGNIITFSDTTTDSAIFYQPNDFIGYSHVQGLYPKNNICWSENALLYFLTLFKKSAKGRFDYATKFNRKVAAQMEIKLPVKNNNIDFEFIESYINIQKKLAIKKLIDNFIA